MINDMSIVAPPTPNKRTTFATPRKSVHVVQPAETLESLTLFTLDPIVRQSTRANLGQPALKYMDKSYLTSV
jgi:hypothetical protein